MKTKTCVVCGKSFVCARPAALTCRSECGRELKRRTDAERRMRQKANAGSPAMKRTFKEILIGIERYNAEHPERPLSYGRYVKALEDGLI